MAVALVGRTEGTRSANWWRSPMWKWLTRISTGLNGKERGKE